MAKLKCASFFAGVGGIDLGFEQTGAFEVVYANELDKNAVRTYELNFDKKVDNRDINEVKTDEIPDFDVMLAGFPCLTGDSLILTKDGYKQLIDIKVGDLVLSHDNQYHKVVRFMEQGIKKVYAITSPYFDTIYATGNHRFYVRRENSSPEWLSVEELISRNDYYMGSFMALNKKTPTADCLCDGDYIWLSFIIEATNKYEPVYDIEVEDSHSFVVNNCITHNCQAFSVAGYREGFDDKKGRGELFFQLERIFTEKKPKIIFLENVKNLVGHDNGRTFEVILESLHNAGYHVKYQVLNAMNYGNIPQNRERIYIVAFLDEELFNRFKFPEPIKLTKTIRDVVDFQNKKDDKYYYTADNCSFYDILENDMIKNDTVYQWRRKYVRENKSNVCPTLTANMGTGGHNVPLILTNHGIRKLTPRECFALQGYPKSYQLPALANSHLYKQAGNSVVVPVIYRIASEIQKIIDEKE